ncbi:DUF1120 domain-containing protein [Pseudomonas sp. O64]|uniref:DUF1120 domain-containing protein n=1 Tax=unclassified Pseudomonas TaxID=196821 RepID=UPI001F57E50C|nr:DUF1120 domain-containing protein [Pseudomonas sp. ArH3a]UNM19849.1 DUF1120 domain-containing protein [Pseudomonas sp. ArH3a]
MKRIVGLTLGIACLTAALSAQAAGSAQLSVKGTIKPAACSLSLTGNGEINYGTIHSGDLSQAAFTPLAEKTTGFNVRCDAKSTFAITFSDLQMGSKVTNILGAGYSESQNFGLGAVGAQRTGGYSVTLRDLVASGTTLQPIMRNSSGNSSAPWQLSDGKVAQLSQYSWRYGAAVAPASISQLTGTIAVKAVINRAADLNLTNEVRLDGRATIVLNYT